MSEEKLTITPESFCEKHRFQLIRKAKFKERDPWMAFEITAQIVMMQVILDSKNFHIKYSGDPLAINRLGCLACFSPDHLKKIIKIAKDTKDKDEAIGKVKEYGDKFGTLVAPDKKDLNE